MWLVTGANGFIGSAFIWELNQRGIKDIIAVDSIPLSERNLLKNNSYTKFLLKNELWDFLKSEPAKKLQWIIHMGACSSTTETNWDFLKENNLEYSKRIFEWCSGNQTKLIYASSAATYGDGKNGFDDRTEPEKLTPLNLYGKSKLLMDQWALPQTKTPKNWYGVKFFNVFGPNEFKKESMASVVFKAFLQIQQKNSLQLFRSENPDYKDGEQLRDFIYVKDVTSWMFELTEKLPRSGIYNMGFGQARHWLDLSRAVFKSMHKEFKIDWISMPENVRGQYQYFTQADQTKWLNAGLSSPKWNLEKAVADYVENYLAKGPQTLL